MFIVGNMGADFNISNFSMRHDDMMGDIATSLTGNTQYATKQYRSTGLFLPHVADGDYWTQRIQFSHRKKLYTPLDGYHIHYIPIASANGTILFDYAWGWYNFDEEVPATLPNTGTAELTLATTDQYKNKIFTIVANMAQSTPANETYSSGFFIKITRNGGTWGNANEIAIWSADAHFITDRNGSVTETNDSYGD